MIKIRGILFTVLSLHRVRVFIQPGKTDKSGYLIEDIEGLRENFTGSKNKILKVIRHVVTCPQIKLSLVKETDTLTSLFKLMYPNLWIKCGKFGSLQTVFENFSFEDLCANEQMGMRRNFFDVGKK